VTIEEIEEQFGTNVALLVGNLTECGIGNSRRERKANYRAQVANATDNGERFAFMVQTIKAADMLDNIRSVVENDPKFGALYLKEAEQMFDCLQFADADLFNDLALEIEACREILDKEVA
jgi:(p)ppGpp synthase/HD superfamily hydrolase